ncbi:MAG: hypothetical protein J5577_05585 [Bacteroidales bacterium]|nr:hypothetical protein [Bacteroidales bacterium]
MAVWWASLSVIMKVLWSITLAASLVFIVQTIMTFIGAAGGDFDVEGGGMDIDFDDPSAVMGSGMNLYTFRNLVNFLLGFGWTFILLQKSISSKGLLILISLLVGLALVAIVMYMFKWLSGMQQSGNIDVYKAAVGCQGTVYLTIPGERSGEGKVQITINNAVREYAALTDSDTLKTGTPIRVVEVLSPSTLLVEELDSLIV